MVVIPEAEVTTKAVLGEPENGTADQTGRKWAGGEVSAGGETGRDSSCSIWENIVKSSFRMDPRIFWFGILIYAKARYGTNCV